VAELGADGKPDQLYHIAYEGTITDEDRFAVLGGETETISDRVAEAYQDGWALDAALRAAVTALAGPDRTLEPDDLEVAVLSRANGRRAFRRLGHDELAERMTPGRRPSSRATKAGGSPAETPPKDDGGPLRSE
jgi:proteasome alpha subunit